MGAEPQAPGELPSDLDGPSERSSAWGLVAALLLTVPVAAAGVLIVALGAADAAEEDSSSETEALIIALVFGVMALAGWVALIWVTVKWWREGRTHVWGLPLTVLVALSMWPLLFFLFISRVRRAVWPQRRQLEGSP